MNKNINKLYKEQLETPWDKPWIPKNKIKGDYTSELLSMLSLPDGEVLITIVGVDKYPGSQSFEIGKKVHLIKETDNRYDNNAIMVFCDDVGKCGYIANRDKTVKQGTISADIIHGGIGDGCLAEILWVDNTFVVCKLLEIDNYKFVFNHAVDYCYDSCYQIALELFHALEKIHKSVELLQRICDCYIKTERYKIALKYAENALLLDENNKRTQHMKSVILDNLRGN